MVGKVGTVMVGEPLGVMVTGTLLSDPEAPVRVTV
jgi:hypothetical protein